MKPKIYLTILNITSWVGTSGDATHVYGTLILSEHPKVTIENVNEWGVKHLGENIEVKVPLTAEMAKKLDEKDGGRTYRREFEIITEHPEFLNEMEHYGYNKRFDTFDEVVNAGIALWKKLDIKSPFISLYEGEKYAANSYEPSSTVILQYGETL